MPRPGTPLLEAVPLADDRLEVDVTPNRPDLLCHKGIARELSASYQHAVPPAGHPGRRTDRRPAVRPIGRHRPRRQCRRSTIEDPESCPRFHAAVIRGVKVGPSPEWLKRRLEAVGVRSINNVVDATNYVMFELNQPMHAYDAATLRGGQPHRPASPRRRAAGDARRRRARRSPPDMIAIADAEGVIGLAGVMGGASTEVGNETRDVLLEGAYWDPARTRRARRTLGITTEASYRFERGIDRWGGGDAMRRCIQIVLATAGGELVGAPLDLWPEPSQSAAHLSPTRAGRSGARRRAAVGRHRAVSRRHRCHRRLQARRRTHRGGRARLAARSRRARST